MRVLSRSLLLVALLAAPAAAERAIVISELGTAAPFSEGELADALRMRLPPAGAPVHVAVSATAAGVIVAARGASRAVELHGRTGPEAARLVALVVVDLVLDDLAIAPAPPPPPVAAAAPAQTIVGVVGSAAQWDGVLAGATLAVAVPRDGWFAALDIGGGTLVGGGLHLSGGIVRLGAGTRSRWLDLRAGATFVPLVVDDGEGDSTVLAGLGSSVRLRLPLWSRGDVVLAAGGDVFATRTRYQLAGRMIETPLVAPWLGGGLEVVP